MARGPWDGALRRNAPPEEPAGECSSAICVNGTQPPALPSCSKHAGIQVLGACATLGPRCWGRVPPRCQTEAHQQEVGMCSSVYGNPRIFRETCFRICTMPTINFATVMGNQPLGWHPLIGMGLEARLNSSPLGVCPSRGDCNATNLNSHIWGQLSHAL